MIRASENELRYNILIIKYYFEKAISLLIIIELEEETLYLYHLDGLVSLQQVHFFEYQF